MTGNVSFTGMYGTMSDWEIAAKYAAGVAINSQEEGPFTGQGLFMVGIPALGGAWGGGKWLYNNYKGGQGTAGIKSAWDTYKTTAAEKAEGFKNAEGFTAKYQYATRTKKAEEMLKEAESNIKSADKRLEKIEKALKETNDAKKIAELEKEREACTKTKSLYSEVKQAAQSLNKSPIGETGKGLLEGAEKSLAETKTALKGAEKPGLWSRICGLFGKAPEASKATKVAGEAAAKSSKLGKLTKLGKGAGIFLAIEAGLAIFTQIIPSFTQLGAEKGLKQTGKSTVKVAARVGGWMAGEAGGTVAGTMLGAAIGSVFPVVGTAIGGVIGGIVGFAGGCLGQWAAGEAADAIVGKDELDIAKEEAAKKAAKEASNNEQTQVAILQAAAQRLQTEGKENPDARIAFASLNKLAKAKANAKKQAETQVPYTTAAGQNLPGSNMFDPTTGKYNLPSGIQNQSFMDQDLMSYGLKLPS